MPKRDVSGSFRSYDDLFGTDETRAEENQEKILQIPVSELHPFKDHPFKVRDDEEMEKMADSIREYGVLVPLLARPAPEGGYEIVSGHRRHHAAEIAGIKEIPVIVREMDDDTAIIAMVDANLQRENILPSERAASYKMKLEAMKRKAGRPSKENSSQLGNNFGSLSSEEMAEELGMNIPVRRSRHSGKASTDNPEQCTAAVKSVDLSHIVAESA